MPAPDSTSRFSTRVKDYTAHRPSYPLAALSHLTTKFPLPPAAVIADIGSGTGILSAQLLSLLPSPHIHVIGIEPNASMREAGDSLLAPHIHTGRFSSQPGTAEATGLAAHSVDLVVAAQAFHWFDVPRARAECARILKPGAGVALLWNDRRGVEAAAPVEMAYPRLDSPVMSAYDLLLVRRGEGYREMGCHYTLSEGSFKEFFGPEGFEVATFENPYELDLEQLRGRLLSSSYTPMEGQEGYEEMMQDLRRLFEKYQKDGKIDFVYDTRVFTGRIS